MPDFENKAKFKKKPNFQQKNAKFLTKNANFLKNRTNFKIRNCTQI